MSARIPRRPKCSASLWRGALRLPGLPGLQPVHHVDHRVHVLGRRRHELHDVVVERRKAHAVALVVHQVGQARAEDPCVVELGDAAAAVVHRLRHVQQHREVHVGFGLVLLDVQPVGAGPHAPVHPAHVVAGHVAAVFGEIYRRAEVRGLVQPVDEPVHNGARHELQVPDAVEHHRIQEPRAGGGMDFLHVTSRSAAAARLPAGGPRCRRS